MHTQQFRDRSAQIGYSAISGLCTAGRRRCFFRSSLNASMHRAWSGTSNSKASIRHARQPPGLTPRHDPLDLGTIATMAAAIVTAGARHLPSRVSSADGRKKYLLPHKHFPRLLLPHNNPRPTNVQVGRQGHDHWP